MNGENREEKQEYRPKHKCVHETSTKAFIGAILMLIMGSTILCLAEINREVWEEVGTLLHSLPDARRHSLTLDAHSGKAVQHHISVKKACNCKLLLALCRTLT
jgi:hypothetical protein